MPVTPEDFALEDYKQKIGYLTAHFTRMWTRFNYLVAIETALVGSKFLIPANVPSRALALAGVLISAVWYLMGAEDRYLVRLYRDQVKRAAEALPSVVWSATKPRDTYRYVGEVSPAARRDLRESESQDAQGRDMSRAQRFLEFEWLSGWRWDPVSTTRLA